MTMTADYDRVLPLGLASRGLPQPLADAQEGQLRVTRYRDLIAQILSCSNYGVADEGAYYTAGNGTPGTAIAHALSAAVSETAGYYLVLKNNDVPANGNAKRLFLDFIKLRSTVAPASGTAGYFFLKLDSINRYASGGSALSPLNSNMDAPSASIAQVWAGALTTVAASASARVVARGNLRGVIPVVGDEWILKFGGADAPGASSLGGTAPLRMPIPCGPVVVGPQQSACLQLWFPSNATTAAEYEVEAGWWER